MSAVPEQGIAERVALSRPQIAAGANQTPSAPPWTDRLWLLAALGVLMLATLAAWVLRPRRRAEAEVRPASSSRPMPTPANDAGEAPRRPRRQDPPPPSVTILAAR
jgi:hypothetical protein